MNLTRIQVPFPKHIAHEGNPKSLTDYNPIYLNDCNSIFFKKIQFGTLTFFCVIEPFWAQISTQMFF
jgi:hypothetical protein